KEPCAISSRGFHRGRRPLRTGFVGQLSHARRKRHTISAALVRRTPTCQPRRGGILRTGENQWRKNPHGTPENGNARPEDVLKGQSGEGTPTVRPAAPPFSVGTRKAVARSRNPTYKIRGRWGTL